MHGLGDQVGDFLLEDVERGVAGLALLLLRLGLGQGLAVHLLVDIERNLVDLHRHGRHHIRRLLAEDELVEGPDIDRLVRHDVGGQELAAAGRLLVEGLHGGVGDAGIIEDHGLHFLELDAEAADFDLGVLASHEFDVAIRAPADDVAGAIDTGKGGIFVEGVGDERFCRLFGQVQVTGAHLRACNQQFAAGTHRQQLSVLSGYVCVYAREWSTDRDVRLLFLHAFADHVAGAFRRTVAVVELVARRRETGHLLATRGQDLESLAAREVDGELGGHLRGHEGVGDAVLLIVVVEGHQVEPDVFRDDMERGAGAERIPQVAHEGVEAETGVGRGTGFRPETGAFRGVAGEGGDVSVREHTALGGASGAAGIE